ncbi:MAG TPA: hypothetical protein ENF44_01485 [Deltaproteobacteria bacterium]|nr:hypothetical protein [Deltaproteobacteria bacterium]
MTLLRPYPLFWGFRPGDDPASRGAYAALKTKGELQGHSRAVALKLSWAFLIFFLGLLFTAVVLPEAFERGLAWLAGAAAFVLWFLMFRALKAQQDGRAFLFSSASFLTLGGSWGRSTSPTWSARLSPP